MAKGEGTGDGRGGNACG